jgi:uncharacterized membrane protein (UPF0136 family)
MKWLKENKDSIYTGVVNWTKFIIVAYFLWQIEKDFGFTVFFIISMLLVVTYSLLKD